MSKDRPNILWLDTEDLSPNLACYGEPLVKTPNLDRLAGDGVRFTNAFVTGAVCSATRSALATGMYQTSIGAHHHRSNRDKPLPKPARHFSHYLREAGYFVCNGRALTDGEPGKLDLNFKGEFDDFFDGADWSQRQDGQPFFAQMYFPETHRQFYRDPDNPIDMDAVEIPPYYPDHPVVRRMWTLYLETIQNLDKKVGKVLQRLEDEGLAENTAVFFWGDHGRPMVRGKQWLYEGGIHIPLIVRWPGCVAPGIVDDKLVSTIDLTPTWLDAAGVAPPEHMEGQLFLGPEHPGREHIIAARDRCDEVDDRIRCVRTNQYKYIRNYCPELPYTQFGCYKKQAYPELTVMQILHRQDKLTPEQAQFMAPTKPQEELFDLQQDPHELNNLAAQPNQEITLQKMRDILDDWVRETGDCGETPEPEELKLQKDKQFQENYARVMERRGLSADTPDEEYLAWWEKELVRMLGR